MSKTKGIILLGSSNSRGNTFKIVKILSETTGFDVIDLKKKNIGHFDYDFKNSTDDFLPIIEKITTGYYTIVFATPVYWYSMSGIMKVFFDRISDCLKIRKDLGRKLRGLNMAMISCSSDPFRKKEYAIPFVETALYLGMNYLGDQHIWIENGGIQKEAQQKLEMFVLLLQTIK